MLTLSVFTSHHMDFCIPVTPSPHANTIPSLKPLDSQDTEDCFQNATSGREDDKILIKIMYRTSIIDMNLSLSDGLL